MLGFDEEIFTADRTVARYMPDLHGDIHSLYIYAPQLVEPTLVGDELVPLLRIARVKGTPGEMVEDTFLTPQYHRVLAKQLSETGGSAYFAGTPYQRGAGIGSVFGSLFRYLLPVLKTFGKEIGREGLSVGSRVLNDIATGSDVRNAVVSHASDGLRNILAQHDVNEGLRGAVNLAQRKLQKGGGSKKKVIRGARRLGGRDNQWVDLSKTYLYLQLQIQKKNGSAWVNLEDQDTHVAPIQSLGQSFVRQLKMSINGAEVYDSSTLYPYICYMKNELSCSLNVKESSMQAGGYFHEYKHDHPEATGFKSRNAIMGKSQLVEFMTKLEFDLANQSLYLLNNLDVLFTIYRHDDNFLIHTLNPNDTNTYRIKVHNVRLYLRAVDVQHSVNLKVANMLEKQSAKYQVRKTEIRSCFLTPGRQEFVHNIFTNVIPRRVIIGMVNNQAYIGDMKKSPFNFQPFDVREVVVNAGGINYPAVPYNLSWRLQPVQFVRAFVDMHDGCMPSHNTTNGITLEQYLDGWTFFVIPLTAALDDCGGFELVRNGTTTIALRFSTPIPDPGVSLICLGEFDQMLSIDKNR
ncbi:Protein F19G12.2, partial [Aphelenchoides avenae]